MLPSLLASYSYSIRPLIESGGVIQRSAPNLRFDLADIDNSYDLDLLESPGLLDGNAGLLPTESYPMVHHAKLRQVPGFISQQPPTLTIEGNISFDSVMEPMRGPVGGN